MISGVPSFWRLCGAYANSQYQALSSRKNDLGSRLACTVTLTRGGRTGRSNYRLEFTCRPRFFNSESANHKPNCSCMSYLLLDSYVGQTITSDCFECPSPCRHQGGWPSGGLLWDSGRDILSKVLCWDTQQEVSWYRIAKNFCGPKILWILRMNE